MYKKACILFLFFLIFSLISPAVFAGGSDYEWELLGKVDNLVKYKGKDTYTVELKVKANNGALIQGLECNLAYDTSVLELVKMDGSESLTEAGIILNEGLSLLPDSVLIDFSPSLPSGWNPLLSGAVSSDGKTAFISMQAYRMSAAAVPSLTSLQTIRLGFKEDKSFKDLTKNSLRLASPEELLYLPAANAQVQIFDETAANFEYGKVNGFADTLSPPSIKMDYNSGGSNSDNHDEDNGNSGLPSGDGGNAGGNGGNGGNGGLASESPQGNDSQVIPSPGIEADTDTSEAPGAGTESDTVNDSDSVIWINPFKDVFEYDWFFEHVKYAHINGIFSGTKPDTFSPGEGMTRAMFAQVLANIEDADLSQYTVSRFSDVTIGKWYAPAIEWAAENTVASGVGEGRFAPEAPVTREQMAVMLYNYINTKKLTLPLENSNPVFTDWDSVSSWATEAVEAIVSYGIIGGKPGNIFDPKATASRAEAVTVFAKFRQISAIDN